MEKYITRDDFLKAKGIDLNEELEDNDNSSAKVERFIEEITDWCIEYLMLNYQAVALAQFEKLSETRQTYFRKGVIEQIDYILRNGLIPLDSGYNAEASIIVNLESLYLAPKAKQKFRLGGFANVIAGSYPRWGNY